MSIQQVALDLLEMLVDNILNSGHTFADEDLWFVRSFRHYQVFKHDFFGDRFKGTEAFLELQREILVPLSDFFGKYYRHGRK